MRSAAQNGDLLRRARLQLCFAGLLAAAPLGAVIIGVVWPSSEVPHDFAAWMFFLYMTAFFTWYSWSNFTTGRNLLYAARHDLPPGIRPRPGDDWSRGIIRKRSKPWVPLAILASLGISMIAVAVQWSGWPMVAAILLQAVFIIGASYRLIVWFRAGRAMLVAGSLPALLGRDFAGTIETSLETVPADGASTTLSCIHYWYDNMEASDTGHEECLWQDQYHATRQFLRLGASGLEIPFRFSIPADALPTDQTLSESYYEWRLETTATLTPIGFTVTFEIPVVSQETANKLAQTRR